MAKKKNDSTIYCSLEWMRKRKWEKLKRRWRLEKMEEFDGKRKTDEIRIEWRKRKAKASKRKRKATEKQKRQRGSGKRKAEKQKQKSVSGKVEAGK